MRFVEILREAARNIGSGTARAGLLVVLAVLGATTLLVVDVASMGILQQRAQDIRDHAGDIRVLVAEHSIDPRACAALDDLDGVRNAGAVWELDSLRLLATPTTDIPVYQVSPGVGRMLNLPSGGVDGVYLPRTLAERWHAGASGQLETSIGVLTVAGIFDYSEDDGRDPRLSNAIVVVGDTTRAASECWFSVWPLTTAIDSLAFGAAATNSQPRAVPQVAPLNPTVGQRFDFAADYSSRPTALSAAVAVIIFGVIAFGGALRRRMEIAGNLHAGARRKDIVAVLATEAAAWSTMGAVAVFVLVRLSMKVLLRQLIPDLQVSVALTLAIAVVAAVCGAVIPALMTPESRLFAIFKARA